MDIKRKVNGSILQLARALMLAAILIGVFFQPTPAYAATIMVNTTDDLDDGVCNAAHCSLREAINQANTNAGSDVIRFDSLPANSIIILDSTLPIVTGSGTNIRANLHPGYTGTPIIGVDGNAAAIAAWGAAPAVPIESGLFTFESSNNEIRGLAIYGFGAAPGILVTGLSASGNVIQDNFIGTDLTGFIAVPNASGVVVKEASGTAIQDNLISGNILSGIILVGENVSNTTVQGNKIGTEVTGAWVLGNEVGIRLVPIDPLGIGPSNNTIGGLTASEGNLISGNATGIILSKANQNIIQSNLIGTDASGSTALGNTAAGIVISEFSEDNQILNNTISSNEYAGVLIEGGNNVVQGNKVGTNSAGTTALGNWGGILIHSNQGGNLIGGAGGGEGNLLSGNTSAGGVRVFGASITSNTIQGNLIGTDEAGSTGLGNYVGIELGDGSTNTLVLDNVISGNISAGIAMYNSTGAVIQGNMIGTDITGTAALGNGLEGINMHAQGTLIGGSGPGQGNVISGNGVDPLVYNGEGIFLAGADNLVQGNCIGTDVTGSVALPNESAGIMLAGFTSSAWPTENNQIGGSDSAEGNVISGNNGDGILLANSLMDGTSIQNNRIGTDVSGVSPIPNSGHGIVVNGTNTLIGGNNGGNVISGNSGNGILFGDSVIEGTNIQNNHIGTDVSGVSPIPNGGDGIAIIGVDTLIGGSNGGNVIAFNAGAGISVIGNSFYALNVEHTISQNSIFQNDGLGIDIGIDGVTLNDEDDVDVGPNTFLNYPEISSYSDSLVEGTACDGCTVEIFSIDEDPSGHGEGESFLVDGIASGGTFNITIPPGLLGVCDEITTTATDPSGNTSEFSPNTTSTAVLCVVSETFSTPGIIFIPGVVVGLWIYKRRKNVPQGIGGFLAGTIVCGVVFLVGNAVLENRPILEDSVQPTVTSTVIVKPSTTSSPTSTATPTPTERIIVASQTPTPTASLTAAPESIKPPTQKPTKAGPSPTKAGPSPTKAGPSPTKPSKVTPTPTKASKK